MPEENRLSRARGRQRLAVPLFGCCGSRLPPGMMVGQGRAATLLAGSKPIAPVSELPTLRGFATCREGSGWSELGGIGAAPLPVWYPALRTGWGVRISKS